MKVYLRKWCQAQRHRWAAPCYLSLRWPLGGRLDRENHYSQRLRELGAWALLAGWGQEREELIVGSGPDVILSGFWEGMVSKISSQAWGYNTAEVKTLSLVWPKLCSLDPQIWSFVLKTVWCWPGPEVLREGSRHAVCAKVEGSGWKEASESWETIRRDKASLHSGKRHVKEMKLPYGYTTICCHLPPLQSWRPSPSLPASSTQHLHIRTVRIFAWVFPKGTDLHSRCLSALGPDSIVPGT